MYAVLCKWPKLIAHKTTDQKHVCDLLVTQIAGSLMIASKFAFTFISASRVTSKFTTFYCNIARTCKIQGIPYLLILSSNSGFKLYGVQISTTTAILAIVPSLISLIMDYLRTDGKQYASKVRNKALEDFDWLSQWLE